MKTPTYLCIIGSLLLLGCGDKTDKPVSAATNASSSGSSPLTAPVDYLGALGKGQQKAVQTADLVTLKSAIQMFNVDKGRNPTDLSELVREQYIPRLPAAPYGMKIVYDAASGTVKVVKE